MGNRLRGSKASGDNALLLRRLYNGSLGVVFVAGLAGVGIVDVLADDQRAHQIVTLQTVFYLLRFPDRKQAYGPLVGPHSGLP